MTKAILINGGNSISSRLTGIQQYIETLLDAQGITHETIQVHQLPAQDLITANFASEAISKEIVKVGEADIVFFLTPIYKGSFTGILKTFIDLLPQKGLENKTVIPVAIGGSIAHLLALEYSLKPILSILGATTISSPIYIVDSQVTKTENGFTLDQAAVDRIEKVWETVAPQVKQTV
ncbi:NADPH-dependent FMN reductase [Solibacillus merdavium]|uniref:NADPH-dependent FMN reductase n=1 Tax=Solibacillus merdavium TaxID=2762218 RepID=A0ABR8XPY7_9BACL|nr:NADPH-dependent FMN reductase [Solibacillus merdavium]MBD8033991.1 NADPH-dependent FMN reductase [Solibacillus merdavium]